jgi:hypothetical protein
VRAKTTVAIFLALSTVAVLAFPGLAAAKPNTYKVSASTSESILARAGHGYRLSVLVFNRRAEMTVEKAIKHGGIVSTSYSLRRRLPAGPDLRFRFGTEADVDLRFVPGKVTERTAPHCTGGTEIGELGHYVGTIRFRGREGFSRLTAHRVEGAVNRTEAGTCRVGNDPRGIVTVGIGTKSSSAATVPKGTLELIAGTPDRSLNFVGYRFDESDLPGGENDFGAFEAWIARKRPAYSVTSAALAGGPEGGFVSPDPDLPLSAAKISATAPFSGSAAFELTSPHHAEWTGDLAVELPGFGRVPLTGPKIVAGLCETKACTPTLPKGLRPRTSGPGLGLEEGTSGPGSFEGSFFSE